MNARTLLRGTTLAFVLAAGAYAYWTNRDNPEPVEPEPEPTTATLRLTVADATGQPPIDCGATLAKQTERGYVLDSTSTLHCETGELSWSGLEPGIWRLKIAGVGTELMDEEMELIAGDNDLGARVLAPGGLISGTVTFEGEPVVGADLRTRTGQQGVSVADGAFAISGVPVGEVEVLAGFEDKGGAATVTVEAGGDVHVDLALETVPPRGVLGVQFEIDGDALVVTRVHPSGPLADVAPGARITAVGGEPVRGLDEVGARELLWGSPGDVVEVTIDGQTAPRTRVDLNDLR